MVRQPGARANFQPEENIALDNRIFREIVEGINDYVFVCAQDYRITYMNYSLMKKLGRDATGEKCHKAINDYDSVCPFCIDNVKGGVGQCCWEFTSPVDGTVYDVANVRVMNEDGTIAKVSILHDISRRITIEENLLKEEMISKGVVNSLPGIFVFLNDDMGLICWNKNFEAISGYSACELAGMRMSDFFTGWERDLFDEKIREVLDRGISSMELRLSGKNGEKTPFFMRSSTVSLDGGIHVIISGNDLLERYEAEKVLHQLSRAVEQSPCSIVITDTRGTIEYVNERFCQVTGYSLDEAIGRNPRVLKSGKTSPEDYKKLWETITSGGEWRGEFNNRKKNGETYWEFASISPIKNADDVITHFLAVKEDITERKKIEWELHKNKAELLVKHEQLKSYIQQVEKTKKEWENTMDCVGDIVILVDKANRIRRCNKSLGSLTGVQLKDVVGRDWQELLSEQGLNIPSSIASGKEFRHSASGRWFVFHSYPFTDRTSNEVTGSVITLHDNTVVTQFTGELEKAYSDLKATQAKVVQQEKMASIGQLAAGVAHEINNPMGFISSNLGTLGKYLDRLDDFIRAQSELIEMVTSDGAASGLREKRKAMKIDYILEDGIELIKESLEGAERVRTIVQNLKSFSRVDEAECKHADLNECILSTINIVWNELKYKASLIKDLGDIPLTKCHPQQINQVIMNLLVNASHAIEKQGEITVRTWHDNGSIYISVADTGCGMPPEVVNRIFEPFFTTKEVGKGTGLGLSITYDIVKSHNGEITVVSEPGKGTAFTVQLPVIDGKCVPGKGESTDA
jgi:two-component system, NtrC family, sensor kinase